MNCGSVMLASRRLAGLFLLLLIQACVGCGAVGECNCAPEGVESEGTKESAAMIFMSDAVAAYQTQHPNGDVRDVVLFIADLLLNELKRSGVMDELSRIGPILRADSEFIRLARAFPWVKQERKRIIAELPLLAKELEVDAMAFPPK